MPKFSPDKTYPCTQTVAVDELLDSNVVTSLSTGQAWGWIKIPKTGTMAYRSIFFPHIPQSSLQNHVAWRQLREVYPTLTQAFTVVRHPMARFRSAIGHLTTKARAHLYVSFQDTQDVIDFFEQHEEALSYQFADEFTHFWADDTFHTPTRYCPNCGISVSGFVEALLIPQVVWAYSPNVHWFKYEDLPTFDAFVRTELGYDHTPSRYNVTSTEGIDHLDFTHPRLVALVERLYYMDYEAYDYGKA